MKTTDLSLNQHRVLVEALIELFLNRKWRINELKQYESGYLEEDIKLMKANLNIKYNSPLIRVSEHDNPYLKINKNSKDDGFEALGRYFYYNHAAIKSFIIPKKPEGHIVLYMREIEKEAKKIAEMLGSDPIETLDALVSIVLLHEFTHCIIYDMPTSIETKRLSYIRNKSTDIDNFHEGLAQYFTNYIVSNQTYRKDNLLKEVFDNLTERQSNKYKVYKELATYNVEDVVNTISFFRSIDKQKTNINQSWEAFKKILASKIWDDNHLYRLEIKTAEMQDLDNIKDKSKLNSEDIIAIFKDYFEETIIKEFEYKCRGRIVGNRYGF